jgi:hypothetical protein
VQGDETIDGGQYGPHIEARGVEMGAQLCIIFRLDDRMPSGPIWDKTRLSKLITLGHYYSLVTLPFLAARSFGCTKLAVSSFGDHNNLDLDSHIAAVVSAFSLNSSSFCKWG